MTPGGPREPDRSNTAPIPEERVHAVLGDRFGIAQFRGRQREAVEAVLAGRDVLLFLA